MIRVANESNFVEHISINTNLIENYFELNRMRAKSNSS
jgi:hypothetical protein